MTYHPPNQSSQYNEPDPQRVVEALQALLSAETWTEIRIILEREQRLLLTEIALAMLQNAVQQEQETGNEQTAKLISLHIVLITRAREIGIDAALTEFEQSITQNSEQNSQDNPDPFIATLREWITLPSRQEHKQYLCDHPEIVDNRTLDILRPIIEQVKDDPRVQHELRLLCEIIAYLLERGNTPARVQDAYVNVYGGFILPLPEWLQVFLQQDEQVEQTPQERAAQWQQILVKAQTEQLAPPIIAEIARQFSGLLDAVNEMDRAQILEIRIQTLQVSLQVYVREKYPYMWALTCGDLGGSYIKRIHGNRTDNIEYSVTYFEAILLIFTHDNFPEQWAMTQNNLGITYYSRVQGDRSENLERAIACFEASLQVHTREAFLIDWAKTQNDLGIAYADRIQGSRAENLEHSIACYEASLQVYTRDTFPVDWAGIQNDLGDAYANRIQGNRAENLEHAITCYKASLDVYTRDAFPVDWAKIQNDLGTTYYSRIQGSRAENLERAIACYDAALLVHTRDAFPADWAMTQNNLGAAYSDRIQGSHSENLERAIACYESTLLVRSLDNSPEQWADTQSNLGTAYHNRVHGSHAENLEHAIACYESALLVHTYDVFPKQWANTQNNLGAAYWARIKGSRAENLERTIAYYEAALLIHTRDAFPERWAMTQSNLGIAYADRIQGNRAENLEQAIACYEASLEVYTRNTFPYEWARSQNNLGTAYSNRWQGSRAENLEYAIACYEASLQVYNRNDFPDLWATTQSNLGNAYSKRIKSSRYENLEYAITCYEASLEVHNHNDFPEQWAMEHINLGLAYYSRIKGNRTENLERAIASCEASLEVYTRNAFPIESELTHLHFVSVLAELRDWHTMQKHLQEVIDIEEIRLAETSDIHDQERVLQDGHDVSLQAAAVAVELGELSSALILVESGRARGLAQARQLTFADPDSIRDTNRRERYCTARDALVDAQAALRSTIGDDHARYLAQVEAYHTCKEQFDAAIAEIELARDPANFLHQQITLEDCWKAAENGPVGHALVYLMPASWGGNALGLFTESPQFSAQRRLKALSLPSLTINTLETLAEVQSADTARRMMSGYMHAQEGSGFSWCLSWPGDTLQEKMTALLAAVDEDHPGMLGFALRMALSLPEYQRVADIPIEVIEATESKTLQVLTQIVNHLFLQLEIQRVHETLANIALRPLVAWLQEEGVTSVTLIPCGQLSAFPLLTTPIRDINGEMETFSDLFTASIAPSALSLVHGDQTVHQRAGIASLGNPLPSHQLLEWSEAESLALAALYGERNQAKIRFDATRDWFIQQVRQVQMFDASCHGVSGGENFLDYQLLLANGGSLTLRDAMNGVADLHGLRLLILSACQTGIVNLRGSTSEMRSLTVGFLQAGANAVMGSLWSVDDLATFLLIVRFAQEWVQTMEWEPPAAALARAQRWLRTSTWKNLQQWSSNEVLPAITANPVFVEQIQQKIGQAEQREVAIRRANEPNERPAIDINLRGWRMNETVADEIIVARAQRHSKQNPDECPFADPYYWAAFQITGW